MWPFSNECHHYKHLQNKITKPRSGLRVTSCYCLIKRWDTCVFFNDNNVLIVNVKPIYSIFSILKKQLPKKTSLAYITLIAQWFQRIIFNLSCQQIELSGVIANKLSGFGLCFHLDKLIFHISYSGCWAWALPEARAVLPLHRRHQAQVKHEESGLSR